MAFHWNYGWYWTRRPDGSVEVRNHGNFEKPDPNHAPGDGRTTLVIPAAQWASIVCSVSKDGETGERWNQAQDFHGRTVARPTDNSPDGICFDTRYAGMSYGTASKEGLRLIRRAAETGSWFDVPEKLIELRKVMKGQLARAIHGERTGASNRTDGA